MTRLLGVEAKVEGVEEGKRITFALILIQSHFLWGDTDFDTTQHNSKSDPSTFPAFLTFIIMRWKPHDYDKDPSVVDKVLFLALFNFWNEKPTARRRRWSPGILILMQKA